MDNLLYAPLPDTSNRTVWIITGLRILLAVFFVFMASKNLMGDQQMVSDFARWGYPGWFRLLTAVLQIVGAVLLLLPSISFYGAVLLGCILVGAIVTHLRFDPPPTTISPIVFLVLTLALALWYRPGFLRGGA